MTIKLDERQIIAGEIIGIETECGWGSFRKSPVNRSPAAQADIDPRGLTEKLIAGLSERYPTLWKSDVGDTSPLRVWIPNGALCGNDICNVEIITPECTRIVDLIRVQIATIQSLNNQLHKLGLREIGLANTTRNPTTNDIIGHHENYLVDSATFYSITERRSKIWPAFLTARTIFAGAGYQSSPTEPFYISQRALAITDLYSENTTGNCRGSAGRAIINLRDQPHSRFGKRLHVICGDGNVLPAALFLKLWFTRMVLWGIQHKIFDDIERNLNYNDDDSVKDLHSIACHTGRWPLKAARTQILAVDFLSQLIERVYSLRHSQFTPEDQYGIVIAREVLKWLKTLEGVDERGKVPTNDMEGLGVLAQYVDWANLFYSLKSLEHSEGTLSPDALQNQSVAYYAFDPDIGLLSQKERYQGLLGLITPETEAEGVDKLCYSTRADFRRAVLNFSNRQGVKVTANWNEISFPAQADLPEINVIIDDPRLDYFDLEYPPKKNTTAGEGTHLSYVERLVNERQQRIVEAEYPSWHKPGTKA